jgi:hypothetical protein
MHLGLDLLSAHQIGYCILSYLFSLIHQFSVDARRPIYLPAFNMGLPDPCEQICVSSGPLALPTIQPIIVTAFGNLQHPTHHCHFKMRPLQPNKLIFHFNSRAKNAAAFFKISFSSLTFAISLFSPAISSESELLLDRLPSPRKTVAPCLSLCSFHL